MPAKSAAIPSMAWSGGFVPANRTALADAMAAAMRSRHARLCAKPGREDAVDATRRTRRRYNNTTAGVGSQILGQVATAPPEVYPPSAAKWDAFIENYNVFLGARRNCPRQRRPPRRKRLPAAEAAAPMLLLLLFR